MLGAVKFSNNLPWEFDADVFIERTNYSTFVKDFTSNLTAQGWTVVSLFYILHNIIYSSHSIKNF